MSLLPYWLGLGPMTYTPYVKIRGGGNKKSPTPSTYLDDFDESEPSGSTMEVYCHQTIEGTEEHPVSGYAQILKDVDTPPLDLWEESNANIIRRDLQIQTARHNRKRMEELRDQAVAKAKEAIDDTIATGSQAVPQQPSNVNKRWNKGATKQRSQETHDRVLDPPWPRGALDEQQQHARQARGLQLSPSLLASCAVRGRRQARQHDGRRAMTHARDRGHHRPFDPPAPTTLLPTTPSSPNSITVARTHKASSPSTTGGPSSWSFSRMPLARGIYGTRHTDQPSSTSSTSPLHPPRLYVPPHGFSSPRHRMHTETAESEERNARGRRSQAPSPTPQHQQLQEAARSHEQQKGKMAERASNEANVTDDPDLGDVWWEVDFLRTVVMRLLGIDSSQYLAWLEGEARQSS